MRRRLQQILIRLLRGRLLRRLTLARGLRRGGLYRARLRLFVYPRLRTWLLNRLRLSPLLLLRLTLAL